MNINGINSFYCPWCKINFSRTDKDGVAECPICKNKRDDGLNQINPNRFQCVVCGCRFENVFKNGPACPNGCKHTGGRNEK
jgi:hypothetical protein